MLRAHSCLYLCFLFPCPQLSWQASEDDLRTAFANCGEINNVRIAWDQEQDRSKGFGHVEFGQLWNAFIRCAYCERKCSGMLAHLLRFFVFFSSACSQRLRRLSMRPSRLPERKLRAARFA